MPDFSHSHTDPGLRQLDRLSAGEILSWLERALRGQEPLPVIVRDEPPEGPILRREQELDSIARKDLRIACLTLLRQFVRHPQGAANDFVASLISLARGLELSGLGADLSGLVSRSELFLSLDLDQQNIVLGTLIDLQVPLSLNFWQEMAGALDPALKPLAVTALLRRDLTAAFQALGRLPADEAVAETVYVILDQHGGTLIPDELRRMKQLAAQSAKLCQPSIASAVSEWMEQLPDVAPVEVAAPPSRWPKLGPALAKFLPDKMEREYIPFSLPARLCPAA